MDIRVGSHHWLGGTATTGLGIGLTLAALVLTGCTGTASTNPSGPEDAVPSGTVSAPALPTPAASPIDDQQVVMQWARFIDDAMNSAQDVLGVTQWSVDHQLLTGRALSGSCAVTLWSFGHAANGEASWQDWVATNRSLLNAQGFPEPAESTTATGQPVLESLLPEGNLRYWSTYDGRNVKIVLDVGTADNRC